MVNPFLLFEEVVFTVSRVFVVVQLVADRPSKEWHVVRDAYIRHNNTVEEGCRHTVTALVEQ